MDESRPSSQSDAAEPRRHSSTFRAKNSQRRWLFWAGGGLLFLTLLAIAAIWIVRPAGLGLFRGNSARESGEEEVASVDAPDLFPESAFSPDATVEDVKAEARRVAVRAAEDFPDDPEALDLRARVEGCFGNTTEAVRLWEKCLSLRPDFAPALHGIGCVAKDKGDFDKASALLHKATRLDTRNREFPLDLVQALMEANRMEEAVVELKRFMQSGPPTAQAAIYLGQACLALDDVETARRAFHMAIQAAPQDTRAHFGLAEVYKRLGDMEKARFHASQVRRSAAADQLDHQRWARTAGRPALVREIAVRAHNEAASLHLRHGHQERAEDLWRRAAALDPRNVESRKRLAALYEQSHRDRDALRVCRQLREIEPANAEHWLNVGLLQVRQNQVDDGLAAIEKAMELDPNNPNCRKAYEAVKRTP